MILKNHLSATVKYMFFRFLTIGLTSLWFWELTQTSAKANPTASRSSGLCNPLGRVVKVANSQLPTGKVLCQRDSVQISAGKQVEFVCFSTSQPVTLKEGFNRVSDYCKEVSHQFRRCTSQNPVHCPNFRNPAVSPIQTLLVPFSSTLMHGRPNFLWEREPRATHYKVVVSLRKKPLWTQTVQTNQMDYPTGVAELQPGKAYSVRVYAFQGNTVLSEQQSVLNRISTGKLALVRSAISTIDRLNLSDAEKIYDQDRILVSQGLLSKSIEILKTQLQQDKTNHVIHRLLGDRYMNAGLPNEAQPYFQEAKLLAQKEQDMYEFAKAQEGLAEIAAIPTAKESNPTANQEK